MEFGKSATNFDSPHAESCPNGPQKAEPPKLPALFSNCMYCRLNWPEKGIYVIVGIGRLRRVGQVGGTRDFKENQADERLITLERCGLNVTNNNITTVTFSSNVYAAPEINS